MILVSLFFKISNLEYCSIILIFDYLHKHKINVNHKILHSQIAGLHSVLNSKTHLIQPTFHSSANYMTVNSVVWECKFALYGIFVHLCNFSLNKLQIIVI